MQLKKTAALSAAVLFTAVGVPLLVWNMGQAARKLGSQDKWLSRVAFGSYTLTLGASQKAEPSSSDVPKMHIISGSAGRFTANNTTTLDIFTAPGEMESYGREFPTPLPSEEVLSAIPYINDTSASDGVITRLTFEDGDNEQFITLPGGSQVRNCTDYDNDYLLSIAGDSSDIDLSAADDEPLVLIYHTHATETFEPAERDSYDSAFSCKTTESDMNIVSVGNEICRTLEENGISVLHDTLVHDYPSYDAAYDSSRQTVSELLEQYPGIKICLDIHRDGIERESGERLAPYCEINGKGAAQIMIIACAGDGELTVPDHLENFKFACALQEQIESDYPELCRPMLFDYRFYNQDLSHGSLLIEVGSQANSIDEVRYTGALVGEEISRLIKNSAGD